MKSIRKAHVRTAALLMAFLLVLASGAVSPKQTYASEPEAGEYEMSGSLSAYLSAMGGVEFGGPLMTGVYFVVDDDGNEYLKLTFTKSSVTIYSITCDTFVDPSPSTVTNVRGVEDGTIGIYDASGNLITDGVTYTLSDDTALNAADEEVNYVDSATFPISSRQETYNLAIYINSNVMGVEFCNENSAAAETTYSATLTVDWNSIDTLEAGAQTTSEETSEETTIEADEDLEGLAIYNVEDEESTAEAAQEAASSAGPFAAVTAAAVIAVIIAAAIVVFAAAKKKKGKKNPD